MNFVGFIAVFDDDAAWKIYTSSLELNNLLSDKWSPDQVVYFQLSRRKIRLNIKNHMSCQGKDRDERVFVRYVDYWKPDSREIYSLSTVDFIHVSSRLLIECFFPTNNSERKFQHFNYYFSNKSHFCFSLFQWSKRSVSFWISRMLICKSKLLMQITIRRLTTIEF